MYGTLSLDPIGFLLTKCLIAHRTTPNLIMGKSLRHIYSRRTLSMRLNVIMCHRHKNSHVKFYDQNKSPLFFFHKISYTLMTRNTFIRMLE